MADERSASMLEMKAIEEMDLEGRGAVVAA
jgi:hypothetical protein